MRFGGVSVDGSRPGLDFGSFKTGQLRLGSHASGSEMPTPMRTTIDISKRGLDDDDFVFLEAMPCVLGLELLFPGVAKKIRLCRNLETLKLLP